MMKYPAVALPLMLLAVTAQAQTPASEVGKPARIPFIRFGQIEDFEADSDKGVYLQDAHRRWYYASIFGPCTGLPFATRIGIDTRFAGDTLDSTGTLLVDGERCKIDQLTTSAAPPKKAKHKH
ncbi:DUF6491 family protein [Sphingomonas sp. RT2P30]|uniref:DUF6491 family protein n=1 Tax=Parasphingomonas halimpatiens TaxID=3096162 RepID=UPI002FC8760F